MPDPSAAAALLRSPEAGGLLHAAMTGGAAAELPGFSAHLTSWQYRPGAEVTAGYEVSYQAASGQVTEHLFATSAEVGAPAATLTGAGLRIGVWRHPGDPRLPGLAPACDPHLVLAWLGWRPAEFDLTLLGYRPLRRAVLRATAAGEVAYLKVLRPGRADQLATRQRLLADAGLTPAVVSRPAPGVLLTPAAPGRALAATLAEPALGIPTAAALVELLDRLPAGLADLPRRPAWADRIEFHAATAAERLPEAAARIAALSGRLAPVVTRAPVGRVVPTHGDFYEANIFVDGARLGLIDLDAAGPGLREDDLACLLAHVAVLPELSPQHYAGVPAVLQTWAGEFAARVHPAALAARVAAVLLSLVAGGAGEQARHRLDLAEQWADRAG